MENNNDIEKNDSNSKDSSSSFWSKNYYNYVAWGIVVFIMVPAIIFLPLENSRYCEKSVLQNDLKKAIINGADLEDLKHIYKTSIKNYSMYELKKNNSVLYKDDVPLSEILNDLKKNYYLEKEQTHVVKDSISVDADSLYFSLLKKIIAENERKNPFDKLEESQKYHFANIQQKMDSDYVKISPEITKIVDEMYNKNQLVTKYLDDSKTSLRISWIALFATLFLSLYQIYLNRKSSKNNNKRFDEIEKKINKKE